MKRGLDVVVAVTASVLLAPVLVAVAVLVRTCIGSPVLFRQPRAGHLGRPFVMLKFRTMTDRTDDRGELLPDPERITRLGRFLRSTSLDELPELWNVIRGDMSLVGPRPLLVDYLPFYSPTQARRHEVRPGITGWAQVNGRNALEWEERFALDVWYVDHRSLALDARIVWLTVRRVVLRTGITPRGREQMERFTGSGARA